MAFNAAELDAAERQVCQAPNCSKYIDRIEGKPWTLMLSGEGPFCSERCANAFIANKESGRSNAKPSGYGD